MPRRRRPARATKTRVCCRCCGMLPCVHCHFTNPSFAASFEFIREPTFVEWLRGGLELSFTVAIDFTGSNGEHMPIKHHFWTDCIDDAIQETRARQRRYTTSIHTSPRSTTLPYRPWAPSSRTTAGQCVSGVHIRTYTYMHSLYVHTFLHTYDTSMQ